MNWGKIKPREKILIGIFLLLYFSFWLGEENSPKNNLSNILYWSRVNNDPKIVKAEATLNEKLRELIEARPLLKEEAPRLELETASAISLFFSNQGGKKVLFEKNIDQEVPIASLSKLMTAWVVLNYYDLSKEIEISQRAANQPGDTRRLKEGSVFTAGYLLYPLLIESSNSAAFALSEEKEDFVDIMNFEARKIGLENTFFFNSTGLDPAQPTEEINRSTARDLVRLTEMLFKEPLAWKILSLPTYSLYGPELINTNRLLLEGTERIIGGKTGYTDIAGGCFVLVTEAPENQGKIINIVLGTNGRENRFQEMKKMINWVETAYQW